MKIKYFLIVLFSGLLLIPFINSNTGFWEFDRKDENRVFTDLVQLDIYRLDKFPKHFESYLQDNFSFRTPLLSLYHHLKFTVLKVSPYPNRTVIGKCIFNKYYKNHLKHLKKTIVNVQEQSPVFMHG